MAKVLTNVIVVVLAVADVAVVIAEVAAAALTVILALAAVVSVALAVSLAMPLVVVVLLAVSLAVTPAAVFAVSTALAIPLLLWLWSCYAGSCRARDYHGGGRACGCGRSGRQQGLLGRRASNHSTVMSRSRQHQRGTD